MNWQTSLSDLDLSRLSSVYFVGVKGVGMAALAILLKQAGVAQVRGADSTEEFVTDALLTANDIAVDDFSTARLPEYVQAVVFSGANKGSKNPLVIAAQERAIPSYSLAQAVGMLSTKKRTLAVCGVGGKSTTSALLSWILETAQRKPSFAVGVGNIPNFNTSARWINDTQDFVVEADEYVADPLADITPRFLYLRPTHTICTSLSFDHPDVYASFEDTKLAFQHFFELLPDDGELIINGDDEQLLALVQGLARDYLSVGESAECDVQLQNWSVQDAIAQVELEAKDDLLGSEIRTLEMRLPGRHNLRNAAYAAVLAYRLGVSWEDIQQAVLSFRSVQRRFEFIGETANQVLCYDDYAHHPREIASIAQTLQEWFPNKPVVVAFEPHTFSRTRSLWNEFVHAFTQFSGNTQILILPIFASAREQDDHSVSSKDLVSSLNQVNCQAKYVPDYQQLLQYIKEIQPGSVCITLGAGTIYKVFDHVDIV